MKKRLPILAVGRYRSRRVFLRPPRLRRSPERYGFCRGRREGYSRREQRPGGVRPFYRRKSEQTTFWPKAMPASIAHRPPSKNSGWPSARRKFATWKTSSPWRATPLRSRSAWSKPVLTELAQTSPLPKRSWSGTKEPLAEERLSQQAYGQAEKQFEAARTAYPGQ